MSPSSGRGCLARLQCRQQSGAAAAAVVDLGRAPDEEEAGREEEAEDDDDEMESSDATTCTASAVAGTAAFTTEESNGPATTTQPPKTLTIERLLLGHACTASSISAIRASSVLCRDNASSLVEPVVQDGDDKDNASSSIDC